MRRRTSDLILWVITVFIKKVNKFFSFCHLLICWQCHKVVPTHNLVQICVSDSWIFYLFLFFNFFYHLRARSSDCWGCDGNVALIYGFICRITSAIFLTAGFILQLKQRKLCWKTSNTVLLLFQNKLILLLTRYKYFIFCQKMYATMEIKLVYYLDFRASNLEPSQFISYLFLYPFWKMQLKRTWRRKRI